MVDERGDDFGSFHKQMEMKITRKIPNSKRFNVPKDTKSQASKLAVILSACLLFLATDPSAQAQENLLKNPGFEEAASKEDSLPNWTTLVEGAGRAQLSAQAKS